MTQSTIFLSTPSARRATVGEVPFTYLVLEFLSTPSARRATGAIHGGETFQWNFYPRPPRGGRLETVKTTITGCYFYPRPPKIIGHALNAISIHALREEGDGLLYDYYTLADLFLSTPSARRATDKSLPTRSRQRYFYPRPPRGGRPSFSLTAQKRF